jgi:diguanylate cyclase (GGDEF)-like protein
MIRKLLNQSLVDLGNLEGEYRIFHLGDDIRQSSLSLIITAIAVLGMLWVDMPLFEDRRELFLQLVAYRVCFFLFTALVIFAIRKTTKVRIFDRLIFGWLSVTIVFLLFNNYIHLAYYLNTAFDIIVVLSIYVLSPLKFRTNLSFALGFSIGSLIIDYFIKTGGVPVSLDFTISAHIIVHVLGLGSSMQLQSYRRKSFRAYINEKDAKEMVSYLANIDPLTKSLTRRHFLGIAESEFLRFSRYHRPLSALVIDADHFKNINDSYGHHAGDIVLRSLALVALEQKRAHDTFGRLGGEEFCLLLPETNLAQAKVVAERIQKSWAESPVNIDGTLIHSTVSIGVAEALPDEKFFEDLLRRADRMMYKAKDAGRNCVVAE